MQGTPITAEQRGAFLDGLASTANVTASADFAGVDRVTFYRHRKDDPNFAAAWDDAMEQATDALEAEARRRAIQGNTRYVTSGGRVVMDPDTGKPLTYVEQSDALMTLLLKAHRPERFKDRSAVENSGGVTLTITSDDAAL